MSKTEIVNALSRTFYKVGFQVKKHSPEILIGAGIVGTVASAVMACKATTKVNFVLEEAKDQVDIIHNCTETGKVLVGVDEDGNEILEEYTPEDSKKDLTIVYAKTGWKLVKLYGPSVALGALSLTGIVTSHTILRKRNVALAAAYATVDKGFKEYRGRVVERFGKDIDRELKYNLKAREIEERVVNEDGTETVVTKTVKVPDIQTENGHNEFSRCFTTGCKGWDKNAQYNLTFLVQQQCFANDRLQKRGYLTLNEVYEALGFPLTEEGRVIGWVYDQNNPKCSNYVDFGIYDLYDEKKTDFVNGWENSIWLDFNVDGNVYDLSK